MNETAASNPRQKVHARLKELDLTQAQLARKLECSKQTVNGWLNAHRGEGRDPFPRHRRIQVALALDLPPSELTESD